MTDSAPSEPKPSTPSTSSASSIPDVDDTALPPISRVPVHVEPSSPRWIAPVALVLSLLAAGAAGWALFKPAPKVDAPGAVADPKAQVCTAFTTVSKAVSIQTKRAPGPDLGPATPIAAEAIAANARLSMSGGASYLLEQLPPNAPEELAKEIRAFASNLNGLAINALAGVPNDQEPQAGLLRSAEDTNKRIAEMCK